jgi:hypothetical protein
MPRSNRPKGRKPNAGAADREELAHLLAGWRRTEVRRDGVWNVQPVTEARAVKSYLCPGCNLEILPGLAHVVAWRADGVLGDSADLAARRHWHSHCWKLK